MFIAMLTKACHWTISWISSIHSTFSYSLSEFFSPYGATVSSGPRSPHCRGFTITSRHHTRWDSSGLVISPKQRPLPDKKNTHKRQAFMSLVGFEPAVSASERLQTKDLDRAATGIGILCSITFRQGDYDLHSSAVSSLDVYEQRVRMQACLSSS